MSAHARLNLDFINYWHAGSGRSSGYHLDALCERDDSQLPILPGRQLKGLLRVDTARLPDAEHQWLAHSEQSELREELFGELFSTAINEQGSAQRYSLRGLQVCIPLRLQAALDLAITASDAALRAQQQAYLQAGMAWSVLAAALPLLDALGAHRNRGLGEARVTLDTAGQGA